MSSPAVPREVHPLDLTKLFLPQHIAVVGASSDEKKLGNIVLRNIIDSGFQGTIFPVNPHASAIRGIGCYQRYTDIPIAPDLAIIALPAALVLETVKEIAEKGTKHLIIFSAGFKEIGPDGQELENKLKLLAQKHSLAILGPNCLGLVNTKHPVNATFGQVVKQTGALRFISQSGAIATSIFDWADYTKLGFSDFVTLGNKTILSETDILAFWHSHAIESDKTIRPIGMYLESIEDGQRFIDVVHQTALQHPIFVLKPGKSAAAASAMQSHTGALAGDDAVFETALYKAGALRCHDLEDMFDFAKAFAWTKPPNGNKVVVISNAGGPAVIVSDAIAQAGLKLATLDADTKQSLARYLPRAASLKNPVDVLGDALAARYEDAIKGVFKTEDVDGLIIILTPQIMTQIEQTAEVIARLSKQYHKPILCSFMGGSQVARGEYILNQHEIPSFRFPERAVKAYAALWQWHRWQQAELKQTESMSVPTVSISKKHILDKVEPIIERAKRQNRKGLDSFEMEQLLNAVGIEIPPSIEVRSHQNAHEFAHQYHFPVVAKLVGPTLLHKTEVKGVITNIQDERQLDTALNQLIQTRRNLSHPRSIMIQLQKQVPKGVEVIIGMKRDAQFGTVLLFGAGGQLANLLDDHSLLIAPATPKEIRNTIEHSKIYPILRGFRGGHEYTVKDLVQVIERFAQLALVVPELAEMEINPLIITNSQLYAVDGKGILL